MGEVGLMQIRPRTAALLGYNGKAADLFVPETNVRLGVAYLARAWQLAKGDVCRALMKYRAGWGEERMTPLSVEYCRRVRSQPRPLWPSRARRLRQHLSRLRLGRKQRAPLSLRLPQQSRRRLKPRRC